MPTAAVDITLAVTCLSAYMNSPTTCHNALTGGDTSSETCRFQQRLVDELLYGGNIFHFREDPGEAFSIHRVLHGRPWEKRLHCLIPLTRVNAA